MFGAAAGAQIASPTGAVSDVFAQHLRALAAQAVGVEIFRAEGTDQGQAAFGAGDGDIEPTIAAFAVDWAEAVAHASAVAAPVADADDHGVAFVALHPLQILDEERFGSGFAEEVVQVGTGFARQAQGLFDAVGVLDPHRDHAQRFGGPSGGVVQDQVDDFAHFGGVGGAAGDGVFAEGDFDVGDAVGRAGAGKVTSLPS